VVKKEVSQKRQRFYETQGVGPIQASVEGRRIDNEFRNFTVLVHPALLYFRRKIWEL
jgi:hypothetical protein